MSEDSSKKILEKELQKELTEEPGLTIPPPQLTLEEEPIPNSAVEQMVEQQKKNK